MTSADSTTALLHHRNGQAISSRALVGFCRRHHVDRLSLAPTTESDQGRTSDPQRMLVQFDARRQPGKFTFIFMAIELSNMVGRRVDLLVGGAASTSRRGTQRLGQETLLYTVGSAETVPQADIQK